MLDHSSQVQRHPLRARGDDCYETPVVAVRALLRAEPLLQRPRNIWEPACGRHGNIVNPLRAAGHKVIATDLVDFGIPITAPAYYRVDFLMEYKLPASVDLIVTNPTFKLAEQFVDRAIALCPKVIMLLRLAFFEAGTGKQKKHRLRARVLDEIPPARIHVFRRRLPMMHRAGWEGRKANSGMAFAWFVWDRAHTGPTTIERISWER